MDRSLTTAGLAWLWKLQHHLPLTASRFVYKKLNRSGHAPDLSFQCKFYNLEYQGNLNNNIDAAIFYYGAFEKPLLHFMGAAMSAIAGDDGVFVDVGANVGQHSLYMSQASRQVIAFEPFAPVRARLEHNCQLNSIKNIEIHATGLSNINTSQPFFAPSGSNAGTGSFDPHSIDKGNQLIGNLQVISGDYFFEHSSINKLHLIKIDVESLEKNVLQGLHKTLSRFRPLVVCEMTYGTSLSFVSSDEILQLLPPDYVLLCFDKRRSDGSKRQRKNALARRSGLFQLQPYPGPLSKGQDDVILCPSELLKLIPHHNQSPTQANTDTTS